LYRAGCADGADGARMIVGQRAFAGLSFCNRDPGRLDKGLERIDSIAIDEAAAGDGERALRGAQQRRRFV
jgi:hypothetical protein